MTAGMTAGMTALRDYLTLQEFIFLMSINVVYF